MTISTLQRKKEKYNSPQKKRELVEYYRSGILSDKSILNNLKISRNLLRSWNRWYFRHRILRYTQPRNRMKNLDDIHISMHELKQANKRLVKENKQLQLQKQALETMLNVAEKEFGIAIRKKSGPKQ